MSKSQSRNKISVRDVEAIAAKLSARDNFYTNGAMRGVAFYPGLTHGLPTIGEDFAMRIDSRLPQFVIDACKSHRVAFMVYDYDTPIAWLAAPATETHPYIWVVPNVKYSTVTSRHQNTLRKALASINKRSLASTNYTTYWTEQ
ncbi:hypothetical protein U27_02613 [Candidatus Vecturithrix granuli]|uniref:Uncharacterized protein n=1 Tax=Vecturithrix granuli TaxID=1499967 RepID=A0A081CB25_VECG1|nr:hypothetical protein U27_02613 [Candidatus Vecturithrix granuli]